MTSQLTDIIPNSIKEVLDEMGFKYKGSTFRKSSEDFILIIDFWNSQWNSDDDLNFWFEIGVFRNDFYQFIFNKEKPKSVRTNHCSINIGNGIILKKGVQQKLYSINRSNLSSIQFELESDFNRYIYPFIQNLNSLESLINLKKLDPVYCNKVDLLVAFGLAKNGQLEKASDLVNIYLSAATYPAQWWNQILEESAKLNLKINNVNLKP